MLESRTRLEPPRSSCRVERRFREIDCHEAGLVSSGYRRIACGCGRAQVQPGAPPPAAPPAAASPPDTLRPTVPPPYPVRRAPNKRASRSSGRVANELNRRELNRISRGRPAYGPSLAASPTYAPPPRRRGRIPGRTGRCRGIRHRCGTRRRRGSREPATYRGPDEHGRSLHYPREPIAQPVLNQLPIADLASG